jgi:diguanylate cyclase (GGDEF)-like protein
MIIESKINRIMIVDRSEVARSIIEYILQKEMLNSFTVTCGSAEEALEYLRREKFDLITTALLLPGLDGLDLCHEVRKNKIQHTTPVIIVSVDADKRLQREGFSAGVTDYFNKSLGYRKLVEFIKDVSQRHDGLVGKILYIEDSLITAKQMISLMENHGLQITHLTNAEEALKLLKNNKKNDINEFDIVFTDFFLEKEMTGGDLLYAIRTQLHYSRQELPVLVVTVQDNEACQADIFHAGANDFITKPVVEEILIARIKSLLLIKHQRNVLKRYSHDIYKLATTDGLTGVRNKQYLLEEGIEFLKRYPQSCLMMVDIDNVVEVNQKHGDIIGDHILHIIAQHLYNYFNELELEHDSQKTLVARFGGKKFTIMISNCTIEQGEIIAEEIQEQIKQLKPESIYTTVSIGLATTLEIKKPKLRALMSAADYALR